MRELSIGFDTSNYTTSCAVFDGVQGENSGRLLDVPEGALGLRQSDALFSHVRRLPEVFEKLSLDGRVVSVAASSQPREAEGSYMPCFLAGVCQAKVLAATLGVPYFEFSHQQGHIAAAAWSAGRYELLEAPHLAWHLSGGTTELLYVKPKGSSVACEIIGGTSDVSAGQVIDRAGQMLSLSFPSGKAIDDAAVLHGIGDFYQPKAEGFFFSLSGVEHKAKVMLEKGASKEETAYFVLMSVAKAVEAVTKKALSSYGDIPVLFSGGVSSSRLLRGALNFGIFAEGAYSVDNALGISILSHRAVKAL